MWWATAGTAAATAFFWFGYFYLPILDSLWADVPRFLLVITVSVALGVVQHEHNAIIRHIGTAIPADDPQWVVRTADTPSDSSPARPPVRIPGALSAASESGG
jgi:hypothetical protein